MFGHTHTPFVFEREPPFPFPSLSLPEKGGTTRTHTKPIPPLSPQNSPPTVLTCSEFGSAVDLDKTNVVPLELRMELLRGFLGTIPSSFRSPKSGEVKPEASKVGGQSDGAKKGGKGNEGEREMGEGGGDGGGLDYDGPPFSALDVRVGLVKKVWMHEDSEKLFCEEVDVGEDDNRMVASGLRGLVEMDALEGRKVLVVCNLKERKLAGFPSHGMVLCASDETHENVKLVDVPTGAEVGERVFWGGDMVEEMEEGWKENKVGKKKVFEKIAPFLKTDKYGIAQFCGKPVMTKAGPVTSVMRNGNIS